jgi:hypothetical protein
MPAITELAVDYHAPSAGALLSGRAGADAAKGVPVSSQLQRVFRASGAQAWSVQGLRYGHLAHLPLRTLDARRLRSAVKRNFATIVGTSPKS